MTENNERDVKLNRRKKTTLLRDIEKTIVPRIDELVKKDKKDINDDDRDELNGLAGTLTQSETELKDYYEKLFDLLLDNDAEFDKEMSESTITKITINKYKEKIMKITKEPVIKSENTAAKMKRDTDAKVKLPTMTIEKFSGSLVEWTKFKETFEAAVDSRDDLNGAQKFYYLSSYLDGPAKKVIAGFQQSAENYKKAWDLLDDRYGNPQLVIQAHTKTILELEAVTRSTNVAKLRNLLDTVDSHVRSLETQGVNKDHIGSLLIPMIQSKIPGDIELEISRRLGKESWKINDFLEQLKCEIEARDACKSTRNERKTNPVKEIETESGSYTVQTLATLIREELRKDGSGRGNRHADTRRRTPTPKCWFCQREHWSDKCEVIAGIKDRINFLKQNRNCFKCLKPNHEKKDCKSKGKCYSCQATTHHTAICQKDLADKDETALCVPSNAANMKNSPVLLQTAKAVVADTSEKMHVGVTMVFDNCAQRSYITEHVAKALSLEPVDRKTFNVNAFASQRSMELIQYELVIKTESMNIYLRVWCVPEICKPIRGQHFDIAKKNHPFINDLELANNGSSSSEEVDILVGADFYWSVIDGPVKRTTSGFAALQSKVGWLLSGPVGNEKNTETKSIDYCYRINEENEEESIQTMLVECATDNNNELLKDEIRKFHALDVIGIQEDEQSIAERVSADIELRDGRYEVGLPIKDSAPFLEDNLKKAEAQAKSNLLKMKKNPELLRQYDSVIQEWRNDGTVEEVDESKSCIPGKFTYLTHHAVIRQDKTTTKVRPVCNASLKGSNGVSFNDCVYKGPSLNPLLYDILLKTRVHRIAISADIEKAYLQIGVKEEDRDLMRITWYDDVFSDNPTPKKFRFTRVFFGATSSQFLLNSTIQKHGKKYETIDPEFARKVLKHFYADDLNTGVATTEKGIDLYKKMKHRFGEVKFNLRKWRTNDSELQKLINEAEGVKEDVNEGKVLGINWDTNTDELTINVKLLLPTDENYSKPTKVNILRIIAGIWDIIGFLQPAIVHLKILFQRVHEFTSDWKTEIEGDLLSDWEEFLSQMRSLKEFRIPRCYFPTDIDDPVETIELHGFSDASQKVYAACIYIKSITRSGKVVVRLVTSKSRIVPVRVNRNTHTIPRAELLGNVILARLMMSVRNALTSEIEINDICYWTDSKCTLAWIKSWRKELKTFCENRVREIRKITDCNRWFYVNTKDNPADIITRSNNCESINSDIWLNGPLFLRTSDAKPELDVEDDGDDVKLMDRITGEKIDIPSDDFTHEIKNVTSVNVAADDTGDLVISSGADKVNDSDRVSNVIDINSTNSLNHLLRVTGFVIRFIENLRRKVNKERLVLRDYVTLPERKKALNLWIADNQNAMRQESNYEKTASSLRLDDAEDGILRSKSRLMNADTSFDARAPIVLTRRHRLAELIVWDTHRNINHLSMTSTLTEIRRKYWIPQGRGFVRFLLRRCVTCKRFNGRSYTYPQVPNLPEFRVITSHPFQSVGVDYLGPLQCKNIYGEKETLYKCWVALYTCAATRGIILDLVPDLEAETFVKSLERFADKRGYPSKIISDNGTNFDASFTQEFIATKNIEWEFIPEKSAWFGGFYERLVGPIKACLKKTLGRARLTFLELQTALLGIERDLNSRPINKLYPILQGK